MWIKIVNLEVIDNRKLLVTFSTAEQKVFDCSYLLNQEVFSILNNPIIFKAAIPTSGGICWTDEVDIAAEAVYENSISLESYSNQEIDID